MWAPILLVALRLLQGLSAGGEWGGAALLSVEHAPHGKRGLFGSAPQIGVPLGMILATGVLFIVRSTMSEEQFLTWGWRIP
ncbi:MFS transporter, partial [Pseudomonas aeruginosa]|uniref:MFS transporter n=1 Tax=Pseudomonas aeruginosa TaxID=287 RepID=UPI00352415AF